MNRNNLSQTYAFDSFLIDFDRGCLFDHGTIIKLRPKSFEVLKYLVEHNHHLVSKTEIMEAVWPDTFVTDDSLVQCMIEVRRALRDDSRRIIKTVPRRGYLFDINVEINVEELKDVPLDLLNSDLWRSKRIRTIFGGVALLALILSIFLIFFW